MTSLLEHIPTEMRQKTDKEYCGPCPWCGGDDRFVVRTDENRFFCRGCKRKGDEIQFIKDFKSMSYVEACEYLGREPKPATSDHRKPKGQKQWTPKPLKTGPGDQWQEKVARVVAWGVKQLWQTDAGAKVLDWLRTERGLTDETIHAARLGWNPSDLRRDRADFGLPKEISKKTGKPKMMWMPAGLVIPSFLDGQVIRVRFRRSEPGDGDRYILLSGSDVRPMVWGLDQKIIVIVESELDGLLLHQAAGDVVGVVAMGSAQARPDGSLDAVLRSVGLILNCLDADEPGAKEAWGFWRDEYRAERWPCVRGKDPGEMHKAGVDVRAWVLAGLPDDPPISIRAAPSAPGLKIEKMVECLHARACQFLESKPPARPVCRKFGIPIFELDQCPAGMWGIKIGFDMEGKIIP